MLKSFFFCSIIFLAVLRAKIFYVSLQRPLSTKQIGRMPTLLPPPTQNTATRKRLSVDGATRVVIILLRFSEWRFGCCGGIVVGARAPPASARPSSLILSRKKKKKAGKIEIRIIARTRGSAKRIIVLGATKADGRELPPPPPLTTSLSSGLYRSGKKKLPTAARRAAAQRRDTHLQDEPLGVVARGTRDGRYDGRTDGRTDVKSARRDPDGRRRSNRGV